MYPKLFTLHTIAGSLLIALGGLKQQPVKNKRPSVSLWVPDTLKKKGYAYI